MHWFNCQNPQFRIPCSKLCPRIKLQTMACYTTKVSILKLTTYGGDKIPASKLKNKNLTPWWPQHAQKAWCWDVAQNGYRQFQTYIRVTFLKLHISRNLCKLELTSPPTHLSHLICYVYISSVSVCTFITLFLSAFLYETHKVKYIFQLLY
jgi:hypothetical protein